MLRFSIILTGVVVILSAACSEKKATLPPETTPTPANVDASIKAKKPEQNAVKPDETRLFGQVSSLNKTLLGFQAAGTIERIYAKPGMFVKKGHLLAELDSRDHQLRAQQAKLQRDQAQNQKTLAERDLGIEKQLRQEQINTPVQLENTSIAYDNAVINLAIAETNKKIAEKSLADTKLRAPYDCVVTRQIKYVGESSTGGSEGGAAFEIYDASPPELLLNAPESLLGRVRIGDEIDLFIPALKEHVPAKVVRYVPIVTESTRNFLIVAHLLKPDKRIVPGYFIEGVLKVSRKSGKTQ